MVGNTTLDVSPTCSASSSSFDTCRPRPNRKLSGIIVCTGLDSLERNAQWPPGPLVNTPAITPRFRSAYILQKRQTQGGRAGSTDAKASTRLRDEGDLAEVVAPPDELDLCRRRCRNAMRQPQAATDRGEIAVTTNGTSFLAKQHETAHAKSAALRRR
jgi:hypothetical protein